MAIYRLSPIQGQTGHPDWAVSDLKQALWVWASDEYEARDNIDRVIGPGLGTGVRPFGQRPACSPWIQGELTECTLDEPEFDVPEGVVITADGRRFFMSDLPPRAVCTKCGKYDVPGLRINQQCSERYEGKRCRGVWGSALNTTDWEECPTCGGTGKDDAIGCSACQATGWIFVRRR